MRAAGQTHRRALQGPARIRKSEECDRGRRSANPMTQSESAEPEGKQVPAPEPGASLPLDKYLVQSALVRALKSPEFQSAPQLRSFLGFIVRATLANQQEKLKGYTIAVEALGRPEDFNPVTDPIVRVEAARLRRRLEKYYSGSGAGDPMRIVVPKGTYAPEFTTVATARPPGPSDDGVVDLSREGAAPGTAALAETRADKQADTGADIGAKTGVPPQKAPRTGRGDDAGPYPIAEDDPLPVETDPALTVAPEPHEHAGMTAPRLSRIAQIHVPLPLAALGAGVFFLAGYLFASG